jgi:hypothetical protein
VGELQDAASHARNMKLLPGRAVKVTGGLGVLGGGVYGAKKGLDVLATT